MSDEITQARQKGMATGKSNAVIEKRTALDNGIITEEPATLDVLMSYIPGNYGVSLPTTQTLFPYRFGVMEIIHAGRYGLVRFTRPNRPTTPEIWQRTWDITNQSWYESAWVAVVSPAS